jgi:perosamine synthetase
MLLLDDEEAYQRCLTLRDHGRTPGDTMFWNHTIGQKYRMSSLQAALGLAQLERLPELIERKRTIFDWYRRALGNRQDITLNSEARDVFNVYWMVTAVLDPGLGWTKENLVPALRERNIDCRPFFYPLSTLPAYQTFPTAVEARVRNSVAYSVSLCGVNLPSALSLTRAQVETVVGALEDITGAM